MILLDRTFTFPVSNFLSLLTLFGLLGERTGTSTVVISSGAGDRRYVCFIAIEVNGRGTIDGFSLQGTVTFSSFGYRPTRSVFGLLVNTKGVMELLNNIISKTFDV